jgi:glucose/arabinose dehydrogenase
LSFGGDRDLVVRQTRTKPQELSMHRLMFVRPLGAVAVVATALLALASPAAAQAWPWTNGTTWEYGSDLHNFRVVTVVEGLQEPWSIAFVSEREILITEKPGRLRIVRDGKLLPNPVPGVPEVRFSGLGGLFDVAVHPDFESNRLIYLAYAKPNEDGSQGTLALARARFDGARLTDVKDIFVSNGWATGNSQYGGRIAFGPDGHLFLTVGDRFPNSLLQSTVAEAHPAQDLMSHRGKIVRLNDDGSVPRDNPFVGDAKALPEIWSYGHRNQQGLAVDQVTGDVWSTEHGPQGGDELNRILPGRNYGWPVVGYGTQYGGERIHKKGTHYEGMEPPTAQWIPSIGASGLMLYTGERFPEWKGSTFVGGMVGQGVWRVPVEKIDGEYRVGRVERPPILSGFGRIRDIRQGPDGLIYVLPEDRRLKRPVPLVRLEPMD